MQSIIFFGDDQYSAIALSHLIDNGFAVAVVTKKYDGNPVEELGKAHNLPLFYYPSTPKIDTKSKGVVASFGNILPSSLIAQFGERGIICLHPSLLPQYRGATPAQYAIALGDKETGITLFELTAKVDEGEIISQSVEPILPNDTTPVLLSRLFAIGADLLISWLTNPMTHLPTGSSTLRHTDPLIFTRRFSRDTGYVEWPTILKMINGEPITQADTKNPLLSLRLLKDNASKSALDALIRALSPWPGVWTVAKTVKGDLRISVESVLPDLTVKISGKPLPIAWSDFIHYYINHERK